MWAVFLSRRQKPQKGALQKIRSAAFDLVLVDLKLPDMDGLQLITEIVNSNPGTLTVLITGHGSIDSAVEAMKRGASDYLTKPFDLDDTLARLRRVLLEKKRFTTIRIIRTGVPSVGRN